MAWDVEYYVKENGDIPVCDYLLKVPPKLKAKILHEIDLLQAHGFNLKEPYVKPITGSPYQGLYELRTKFASNASRILYFAYDGQKFILLHGITKKSEKTPPRDLKRAKRYMEDYKRRCYHDETRH